MAASRRKARAGSRASASEEKEHRVFEALAELLRGLGHDVHVSRTLEGRGGDCLVRGSKRVIVSRRLPMGDRVDILLDVLRRHDLRGIEVPEEIAHLVHGAAAPNGA